MLRHSRRWMIALVVAVLVLGSPVLADEHPADEAVGSRLHWSAGFDFVTESWFRGIAQENQDFIFQPWLSLQTDLIQHDQFAVATVLRVWNSINMGPSGYDGPNADAWYESDFYGGMAFTYDRFRLDVGYMVMFSPGAGGRFAEEVNLTLAFDDSECWGDGFSGLKPHIKVAFETDAGRDGLGGAGNEGIYLELGIAPRFRILDGENYPVDLVIPAVLGLNLGDYYETASGVDNDDTFGFVDVGAEIHMPLTFIPKGFGLWKMKAGVHLIYLGDSAQQISSVDLGVIPSGDDLSVYGVVGFEMNY